MLYWDNQISLLRFLPVPPSGYLSAYFPWAHEPVSQNWTRNTKEKEKRHKQPVHTLISPKPDVPPNRQISHWCGWHCIGVQKCRGTLALDRHEMENGVKGQRAGCVSSSISHALACIFLFLALHMVMVSYTIPFSSSDINNGRFKSCNARQAPGTLLVCLGPISSKDFQMCCPGQRWKHLSF